MAGALKFSRIPNPAIGSQGTKSYCSFRPVPNPNRAAWLDLTSPQPATSAVSGHRILPGAQVRAQHNNVNINVKK
jgi:hypothetical protein